MSWIDATIRARTDWSASYFSLTLDYRLSQFEPGQWVRLGLELGGSVVRRTYSIASAVDEPLEFYLSRVDQGELSAALHGRGSGAQVLVEDQAHGSFTLARVPRARDGWLISSGTGIAPFLSMMRSGRLFDHFERFVLVSGVGRLEHLAYRSEIEARARTSDGRFRYVASVSRERGNALHGRVTETLADGQLERAAGLELTAPDAQVLLCGNPAMIRDMTALLARRGLRRNRRGAPGQVTSERFW
jgi:ferredoxin--NADP+ reductase